MDEEILKVFGGADYTPANVPELLRLLRWPPNRQQQLQAALQRLELRVRVLKWRAKAFRVFRSMLPIRRR